MSEAGLKAPPCVIISLQRKYKGDLHLMSLVVKEKAKEAIEALSEEKARVALDFIDYLREREEWEATAELLSDKKLLMDYKAAREEIKKGNTVKLKAVRKNV
jgi:PHD/YefM family antitoxin component YafN of YafNO toxin-antitoxin module